MKAEFYDVKNREKIQAAVTEKVKYGDKGRERYAFRAKTNDGRNLTRFVSKKEWDSTSVQEYIEFTPSTLLSEYKIFFDRLGVCLVFSKQKDASLIKARVFFLSYIRQ